MFPLSLLSAQGKVNLSFQIPLSIYLNVLNVSAKDFLFIFHIYPQYISIRQYYYYANRLTIVNDVVRTV